jgi:methylated-DNA-[protein]-cysteine S-methyltransferase
MSLAYKMIHSPVGSLKLVASDKGLVAILWQNEKLSRVRLNELVEDVTDPILLDTERELGEYFAGKRKTFSVPLDMRGTPFQKNVWHALLAIPLPCHRVIGSSGKLTGFAGGLETKAQLLNLEGSGTRLFV